ncbi:MAG: methyltransferase [Gemmiger sp.]|uniref:tRNA1(Val) (adenine(37)-N6)-methyltransferase n=1 Tax=Gemmiger sp. TaxID=2049027 RepID=UPI002E7A8BAF|nr:methyltransferase [Gemmiger sp.]MEE0800599.1 methyltransferase [Gemmiger sp.]
MTPRTEILDHGTPVLTAPGAGFGTDALLLARFARPRRDDRALDLCSGCGIVALVWHDEGHRGPCTALELDAGASGLCRQAAALCGAGHIRAVCADLREFCQAGPERGGYDFAACNPPYFRGGHPSPDPRRAIARHDGSCTVADAAACAARALREGGKFVLCQRPDQMAVVFCALSAAGLEPKRVAMVRQTPQARPWLFLVEAQKGRRPGLVWEPDILTAGGVRYGPAR